MDDKRRRYLVNQAVAGHIPTNHYLARFKLRNDDVCPNCKSEAETLEHLFFKCPMYSVERFHFYTQNSSANKESKQLDIKIKLYWQILKRRFRGNVN